MHIKSILAGAATLAFLAAPAIADEFAGGAIMSSETGLGEILTDSNGMTLYIFDNDAPGVSNCYEQCAINWPPLFADDGATASGDFTLVDRSDGTTMWAHDGMPLYFWKNDFNPGDTTGDGVGGVWHVVPVDAM
jgi:predicted lipoprotein with Yx(FWY)xxD motif